MFNFLNTFFILRKFILIFLLSILFSCTTQQTADGQDLEENSDEVLSQEEQTINQEDLAINNDIEQSTIEEEITNNVEPGSLEEKMLLVQKDIDNIIESEKLDLAPLTDNNEKEDIKIIDANNLPSQNSNIAIKIYKDKEVSDKKDKRISTLLNKITKNNKQITVENSLFASGLEDNINSSLLNIKNPIILVSEPADTLNYSHSINLCSIINDSNNNINCIVYKAKDKASKFNHIRKDLNNNYSQINLEESGDLMIIRSDELLERYKNIKIEDAPLDLITFLNGDYFFMFTDSRNKVFLFDQLVTLKQQQVLNIVAFNEESKSLFIKLVAPQFKNIKFNIQVVSTESKSFNQFLTYNLCNKTNNDLYIYFGSDIPDTIKNILSKCANAITPISFSDASLKEIESISDYYSLGNVISYYDSSSVANFIDNYLEYEGSYLKSKSNDSAINIKPKAIKILENKDSKSSPVSSSKLPTIKEYQLNNTPGSIAIKEQRNIIRKKENEQQKIYLYGSTTIKTFGIRYALVASRYTKQDSVVQILDSIIKDYSIINTNFLTPDMKKFGLSDLILGTSSNNPFLYHNGIYFYPRILLTNSIKKSEDQTLAIKIISSAITLSDIPSAFGPNTPNADQLQIIASKITDLNEKRKEISAIQIVQRELKEVEEIVSKLKSGKKLDAKDEKSSGLVNDSSIIESSNTPVNQSLDSINQNKQ